MNLFNKNKPSDDLVWAIKDERAGNNSQISGVLKELNLPYKTINIKYNFLVLLPNFFLDLFGGTIHIANSSKLIMRKPWPKVIIACGRRSFLVAKKIKKLSNFHSFHLQLMYPSFNWNTSKTDLIAIPVHDKIKNKSKNNIIITIGSANKFSNKYLKEIKRKNIIEYKKLNSPIVLCIIGGNTKHYNFTRDMATKVINKAKTIAGKKGTILITTSRRTNKDAINEIDKLYSFIKNKKIIYHPTKLNNNNPYEIFLSFADEIIVTGDSISMISEACSAKKPVRIFSDKDLCSKKHLSYHNYLIKNNYAIKFDDKLMKKTILKELNASKKIATKLINIINKN